MSGIDAQTLINFINDIFFFFYSTTLLPFNRRWFMRERKRTIVTRDSRQKKRFFFQKHVFRLFLFTSSPNRDSCLSCTDFLNKRKRRRGRRKELGAFRRFSREGESHERRSLLLTLVNCIFTGDRYRPSYACFYFTWEGTSDANAEEERSAFEKLFVYFWFGNRCSLNLSLWG